MPSGLVVAIVSLVACAAWAAPCAAQEDDGRDRSWLRERLRFSGEASASVSTHDAEREGWFNYADYETSTVRSVRLSLVAELAISQRLAVLTEVRSIQFDRPEAYALYLRIRPWLAHDLDVHIGRVPPTFGSFPRRLYVTDNPLIGFPLAYQYLTANRADAVPATVDELVSMRARGWETTYSVGNPTPASGLPLANALRWDTGVQVRWQRNPVTLYGALTQGTLGDPRLSDDNGGAQAAGRIVFTPHPMLALGASAASGPYLSESLAAVVPEGRRVTGYRQDAYGADVEVSRDRWLLRGEVLWNRWAQPATGTDPVRRLGARGAMVEGRYTIVPGVYIAARADRLDFSRVATREGAVTWDADVWRLEAGGGWRPHRHLLLKAVWQRNRRDGGRIRARDLGALQVVTWF